MNLTRGLTLAIFSLFFFPALFGYYPSGYDSVRSDYGYLTEFKRTLLDEGVPWISKYSADEPILGNAPLAALYPPFWTASMFRNVELGFTFFVALHMAILFWGGSILSRSFGAPRRLAWLGGVALVLCGSSLDLIRHGQSYLVAAWFPLAWGTARISIRLGMDWRRWVILCLSAAAILLGGEPQTFCVLLGAVGLETLFSIRSKQELTRGALGLTGLFIAFGIAWAHWSVALAHLQGTHREGALPIIHANLWMHAWPAWLAGLIPGLWSLPVADGTDLWDWFASGWNLAAQSPLSTPWNASPFFGIVSAILLGATLSRSRIKHLGAPLTFGILCFFISLGAQTPIFAIAREWIPGVDRFRYPEKYALYFHWTLLAIAFSKSQLIFTQKKARNRFWIATVIAWVVLLAGAALSLDFTQEIDAALIEQSKQFMGAQARAPHPLGKEIAFALLISAATLTLTWVIVGALRTQFPRAPWVASLLLAELVWGCAKSIAYSPSVFSTGTPWFADRLSESDSICASQGVLNSKTLAQTLMLQAPAGISPLYRIRHSMRYSQLLTQGYISANEETLRGKISGLLALGCTHILTLPDEAPRDQSLWERIPPPPGAPTSVWRLKEPTPNVFELTPAGVRTDLVQEVSRPVGHRLSLALPPGPKTVIGTRIQHYPGWRAVMTVSGQAPQEIPMMILRGVLIGAEVPMGAAQRRIEFDYSPPGLIGGLWISLISCLACWGGALFLRRRALQKNS